MVGAISDRAFADAARETLTVSSGRWGVFGPSFRVEIPAVQAGRGLYKISKRDWDATVGPVFERMRDSLLAGKRGGAEFRSVANGYLAMEGGQVRAFHRLMQSFAAAADSSQLALYPGTPETNGHLAELTAFVAAFNGPEQAVRVSGVQLRALGNIARRALEFSHEESGITEKAKSFYSGYLAQRPGIHYSDGLIRALS